MVEAHLIGSRIKNRHINPNQQQHPHGSDNRREGIIFPTGFHMNIAMRQSRMFCELSQENPTGKFIICFALPQRRRCGIETNGLGRVAVFDLVVIRNERLIRIAVIQAEFKFRTGV